MRPQGALKAKVLSLISHVGNTIIMEDDESLMMLMLMIMIENIKCFEF